MNQPFEIKAVNMDYQTALNLVTAAKTILDEIPDDVVTSTFDEYLSNAINELDSAIREAEIFHNYILSLSAPEALRITQGIDLKGKEKP